MSSCDFQPELAELLELMFEEELAESDCTRLNELLIADQAARSFYLTYVGVNSSLSWQGNGSLRPLDDERLASMIGHVTKTPPVVIAPLHLPHWTAPALAMSIGIVALAFYGVFLLIAWNLRPDEQAVASDTAVGTVSHLSDVRWSPASRPKSDRALIAEREPLQIESGTIELELNAGTKLIVEGPADWSVDSQKLVSLRAGKLTAFVPKQAIGFTVETPTARVIDRGTEFGVLVNDQGTELEVFQGRVDLAATESSDKLGQEHLLTLTKGEVGRVAIGQSAPERLTKPSSTIGQRFAHRRLSSPRTLDLLDVVAGGIGTGNRRERGIDATTGNHEAAFFPKVRSGDVQFHRVGWHKLIDSVFIPAGGREPVTLDSAGHTFDGFPHAEATTFGTIWSRAADVPSRSEPKQGQYWIYEIGRGEKFMPEGRGLLAMSASSGVTFSLEAVRKTFPEALPIRFRATAGLTDGRNFNPNFYGLADIWVFVDGQVRFKRTQLRPDDGVVLIDLELGRSDRFLTLAVSDGGNGQGCDWVVFGEPVLEMATTHQD